uniref:Androgen induced inhibitor of proliferation (As3) / pds5, putative n=1 Tax=Arundo donax TaxID=35708 RepID=A0A0A9EYV6_ARUDO
MLNIIIEHLSAATVSNIFILLVRYGLLVSARSTNMLINSLNISLNISSLNGGSGARIRITSIKQTATRSLTSLSLWLSKVVWTRDLLKG